MHSVCTTCAPPPPLGFASLSSGGRFLRGMGAGRYVALCDDEINPDMINPQFGTALSIWGTWTTGLTWSETEAVAGTTSACGRGVLQGMRSSHAIGMGQLLPANATEFHSGPTNEVQVLRTMLGGFLCMGHDYFNGTALDNEDACLAVLGNAIRFQATAAPVPPVPTGRGAFAVVLRKTST